MNHPVPESPKIYHIAHIDRLASILSAGKLICDAEMQGHDSLGTSIGMRKIKQRRLTTPLNSHPGLCVGDCVPFYFCPRSVMLYMFWKGNSLDIDYHGGQAPIVHLVADLYTTVRWANQNGKRWVFTDSNAGSSWFDDFCDLKHLSRIDWDAVCATNWQGKQDKKQAEFLIESAYPWACIEKIGVFSEVQRRQMTSLLDGADRPPVCVEKEWYYL